MADFTYLLMQWVMPGLEGADFKALNIPTMEEVEQIYCKASGNLVDPGSQLVFFLQSVPPRGHRAGHRQAHRRWHGGQRKSCGIRCAPHPAGAGIVALRRKRRARADNKSIDVTARVACSHLIRKRWRMSWVASRASPSLSQAQAAAIGRAASLLFTKEGAKLIAVDKTEAVKETVDQVRKGRRPPLKRLSEMQAPRRT